MVALSTVGLIIAAASFLTFVIIFGRTPLLRSVTTSSSVAEVDIDDPINTSKGPIGALQRLLTEKLPHTLQNLDHVLTNGQLGRILARLNQYVLYEGNPIILCIFLLVLSVSIYLFVQATYTTLPLNHRLVVPLIVATPYILTYLCVTSTASYITRTNHRARSLDYPYDHALFKPGISCGTCKWTKPARSKHCSFCRACVSKCDHHCPWVNNCLGRDNYRWFLALLLSLGVLTYYGSYLAFCQLWPVVHNKPSEFKWNTRPYWDQIGSEAARAFEIGGLSISGVGLLAFLTAPLPWSFLAYHAYLLWAGMTTNESQKWSDMRDDMLDGSVFRCKRSEIPGLGPDDPHVPWPVSSDQAVVWTSDGRPPDGQEGIFERIWDLGAVDNIYDLGIWDNMMHVLQGR